MTVIIRSQWPTSLTVSLVVLPRTNRVVRWAVALFKIQLTCTEHKMVGNIAKTLFLVSTLKAFAKIFFKSSVIL